MSATKIEWTDETWNPIIGCSRVSPGCDRCYAVNQVHRGLCDQHRGLTIRRPGQPADWTGEVRLWDPALDQPLRWRRARRIFVCSLSDLFHPSVPDDTIARIFAVMALAPQHTFQILTKRPQRMADWFAYDFLGESQQVIVQEAVTTLTRRLGWARPVIFDGRMVNPEASTWRGRLADDPNYDRRAPLTWPLPNVWLGTSIESDRYAFRADHLRRTPAAVRWISAEPLLGPLPSLDLTGIDWIVVGGETGHGSRPMHPNWVRDLRDRCTSIRSLSCTHGVGRLHRWEPGGSCPPSGTTIVPTPGETRFFFKQWGDWLPVRVQDDPDFAGGRAVDHPGGGRRAVVIRERSSQAFSSGETRTMEPGEENGLGRMLDADTLAVRVGKGKAGRELDGRIWDEYPEARL